MKRIDELKKIIAEMDAEQMGEVLRTPVLAIELLGENVALAIFPSAMTRGALRSIAATNAEPHG